VIVSEKSHSEHFISWLRQAGWRTRRGAPHFGHFIAESFNGFGSAVLTSFFWDLIGSLIISPRRLLNHYFDISSNLAEPDK